MMIHIINNERYFSLHDLFMEINIITQHQVNKIIKNKCEYAVFKHIFDGYRHNGEGIIKPVEKIPEDEVKIEISKDFSVSY